MPVAFGAPTVASAPREEGRERTQVFLEMSPVVMVFVHRVSSTPLGAASDGSKIYRDATSSRTRTEKWARGPPWPAPSPRPFSPKRGSLPPMTAIQLEIFSDFV
jgi:hypothetical protein